MRMLAFRKYKSPIEGLLLVYKVETISFRKELD